MTVVLGKMGSSSGWRNNGFSGADLTPPGGCVEGGKVAEGCLRMDRFFFGFDITTKQREQRRRHSQLIIIFLFKFNYLSRLHECQLNRV